MPTLRQIIGNQIQLRHAIHLNLILALDPMQDLIHIMTKFRREGGRTIQLLATVYALDQRQMSDSFCITNPKYFLDSQIVTHAFW